MTINKTQRHIDTNLMKAGFKGAHGNRQVYLALYSLGTLSQLTHSHTQVTKHSTV